jgi:hypothetical protein
MKCRTPVFVLAACLAAGVASAEDRPLEEPLWVLPSRAGVPVQLRGIPLRGRTLGAAVACGRRSQDWAARYRAALTHYIAAHAASQAEIAATMQSLDEYVTYGRRNAQAEPKSFCNSAAGNDDLARADSFIAADGHP